MSSNQPALLRLKPRRDAPVKAGHPWIFSKALQKSPVLEAGTLVFVENCDGVFLGTGLYHPNNDISVRMITSERVERLDAQFFAPRFMYLDAVKKALLKGSGTAWRIAHSDADGLPGLIVDRYRDVVVFQIHTAGMDRVREAVVAGLVEAFGPRAVVERSDVSVRRQEGLSDEPTGLRHGALEGPVPFEENGLSFFADPLGGQKTGFFLDQRETRQKCRLLSAGRNVLNLFGYTGAFSVYALKGGAERVTTVEISKNAPGPARKNFEANQLDFESDKHRFCVADAFRLFDDPVAFGGSWDLIICDPPAFAKSIRRKQEALEAYTRLNARCFSLLEPGGILMTSSCTGAVTAEEFRGSVRLAAGFAGRRARVVDFIGQPPDHTETLAFPEGRYLKTLVLEVTC